VNNCSSPQDDVIKWSDNVFVCHCPVVCDVVLLLVASIVCLLTMASNARGVATRAMQKRRALYDRVHDARERKAAADRNRADGRNIVDITPVNTYYDFLERFLGDRIGTLSIASMLRICTTYYECLASRVSACMPVFLAFHDVICKVLNNHVASTREQRKRLLRDVLIAHAGCKMIVRNPSYAQFKRGVSALRRSIDELGTVRIQRKPIPSDVVTPYRHRVVV